MTKSPIELRAISGSQIMDARLPANADISSGVNLVARAGVGTTCPALASIGLQVSSQVGLTRMVYGSVVDSRSSNTTCSRSGTVATHEVLLTLRSSQPVAGTLSLSSIYVQPSSTASAQGSVDVGGNGVVDLLSARGGRVQIPAVLSPGGLSLVLEQSATVTGIGNTSLTFVVEFVPVASAMPVLGMPCRGLILGGFRHVGGRQVRGSGVPAGSRSLLPLGLRDPMFALPPLGCVLHTDLLATLPAPALRGGYERNFSFPAVSGRGVHVQLIALTPDGWNTSNGIRLAR